MLTITPAAEEALDAVVSTDGMPEGSGVRITRGVGADGQPSIGLMVTSEPEAGDELVDDDAKVPVYVAQEVAPIVDDLVLDAHMNGDEVAFELGQQPA